MLWYGGSIAEAVNLSKQRNAIFVVFIEGENDLSTEMAAMLDDAEITKRLSDEEHFLAIKLTSGSTDYVHFAQMYQFVPVPSVFFIGRSGVPLEVVCAGVQPAGLADRVDRILEEHKKANPIPQQNIGPSTSSQSVKQQTASLLASEAKASEASGLSKEASKAGDAVNVLTRAREEDSESSGPASKVQKTEEYDIVCEGDVCKRVPKSNPGPSTVTPPNPEPQKPVESEYNAEEEIQKMERAKEIIEARRREKAEKDKELEKQKELERRATGQGVAELRRWQEDQEMRNIQEERKREKMENNLARLRVLDQIAQDRAERKAREQPAPAPATTTHPGTTSATGGDAGSVARLQFKLPDGGSHQAQFSAEDVLGTVRDHVAQNLNLNKNNFTLWTAFPRQELVSDTSTLRELSLAPSAALLVVSRQNAVASTAASPMAIFSFLTTFFSTLVLEPSYQLYAWLRARLFPPTNNPTTPPTNPPSQGNIPSGIRRRVGNVHRLAGDNDDDNNTWNGNSTQQM